MLEAYSKINRQTITAVLAKVILFFSLLVIKRKHYRDLKEVKDQGRSISRSRSEINKSRDTSKLISKALFTQRRGGISTRTRKEAGGVARSL